MISTANIVINNPAEQKKYQVSGDEATLKISPHFVLEENSYKLISPNSPAPLKSVAGSLT